MTKVSFKGFRPFNRASLPLYTKLVLEPMARLIAMPIINWTSIKPYQVTLMGLGLGFYSAYSFYVGDYLLGALIFQLAVVLDLVDGYVARIKKSGSVFGILLDGYSDQVRLLVNIVALVLNTNDDPLAQFLLMLFLFLHTAEAMIDFELINVRKFLTHKTDLKFNALDRLMLSIKRKLEQYGLRTIFLYTQERVLCVLFMGPIFGDIKLWTQIGIVLVLFSVHIKMVLDVALIKNVIINKTNETLR